jgi:hypothetical protein
MLLLPVVNLPPAKFPTATLLLPVFEYSAW